MMVWAFLSYGKAPLDKAVTGGIYRISRNPMYTSFIIGVIGATVATASAWRHCEAICAENPDEPKAYDMHTKARIYPAIATLQAMTEAGVDRRESIDFLCEYYLWRARGVHGREVRRDEAGGNHLPRLQRRHAASGPGTV